LKGTSFVEVKNFEKDEGIRRGH